jgi:inorganic triphosphatase YgiF
MNTPRLLRQDLDIYFDITDGYSIKELRDKLDYLESRGATHVEITTEDYYGDTKIAQRAYCERLETADEVDARVMATAAREAQKREYELKQLEDLKRKYESQ